jgi:hypothetical protein
VRSTLFVLLFAACQITKSVGDFPDGGVEATPSQDSAANGGLSSAEGGVAGTMGTTATGGGCARAQAASTWAPMSTQGALENAHGTVSWSPSAFWTGRRMVVFSGLGDHLAVSYDPCADVWAPVPLGALETWDTIAGMAGTSLMMFVLPRPGGSSAQGIRLDAEARSWSPINMLGAPRGDEPDILFDERGMMVFVAAGFVSQADGHPTYDYTGGRAYDLATDEWRVLTGPAGLTARSGAARAIVGGRLVVWGGYTADATLNDGAVYDLAADHWKSVSVLGAPSPRTDALAVSTGSELIVWGGGKHNAESYTDGAIYDPASDRWRPMSARNSPQLLQPKGIWTGRTLVVINSSARGGIYDPAMDTWTTIGTDSLPSFTSTPKSAELHVTASGRVFLFVDQYDTDPPVFALLEPDSNRWTPPTSPGAPTRAIVAHAWTGDRFIAWGGMDVTVGRPGCPTMPGCDGTAVYHYSSDGTIFRAP